MVKWGNTDVATGDQGMGPNCEYKREGLREFAVECHRRHQSYLFSNIMHGTRELERGGLGGEGAVGTLLADPSPVEHHPHRAILLRTSKVQHTLEIGCGLNHICGLSSTEAILLQVVADA